MIADLDTLLIALYVELTDRIIPSLGFTRSGPGRRPEVTDAELVCLAVAQVLLRYDDERHWLRAASSRVGHLFPVLLRQSEYNERLKTASPLLEAALRWLADHTPGSAELLRLMDATPVPCGHSVVTTCRSDLFGYAGYGYCASHSRWYWGSKLMLIVTCDGTVTGFALANPKLAGEREAARKMLEDPRIPQVMPDRAGRQTPLTLQVMPVYGQQRLQRRARNRPPRRRRGPHAAHRPQHRGKRQGAHPGAVPSRPARTQELPGRLAGQIRGGQATVGQPLAQIRQQMHMIGDRVQGIPPARQVLAHAIGERGERTSHHDPPRPPCMITRVHDVLLSGRWDTSTRQEARRSPQQDWR